MKRFFEKYKQLCSYIFWGSCTTIVNYSIYFLFTDLLHIHHLISNVIAWVISVIFAFGVNKVFVFDSENWGANVAGREFLQFVSARLLSGAFETGMLFLFVDILLFPDSIIKIMASIVIVIMNYVISKLFIFKK